MQKRVNLYTVTGFLGSGKTSFLKDVLSKNDDMRVGVIQNEFGKIGIDGDIIKKDGLEMIEINRGSIFCSCLQLSFIEALKEMADREVDYLFVEGSGLADPSNMDEILDALSVIKPDAMDYKGAICVVDGVHFMDQLEEIETVRKQVMHAQLAIINKRDLIDEMEESRIKQVLSEIKADICIETAEYGVFDFDFLKADLLEMSPMNFDKTHNKEENKPKTLHLTTPEKVNREKLLNFLGEVCKDCYRIKGYLEFDTGWHQVDVVGRVIDLKPVDPKDYISGLVFISKVGPQIIKPIFSAWESALATPMKLR